MRFATALALAAALFVALPIIAHRLRRRRAKEIEFAGTQLLEPKRTEERRRAEIEDKALLSLRVFSILALACLGASPFVRCSRVGIDRDRGASVAVALVVDDSMSMRAKLGGGTRFERAREGALELASALREGDSVAIILASRPARVVLPATNDVALAKKNLAQLFETDRATDLDGALELARGIVKGLPQTDRRVALFSDLADGSGSKAPLFDDVAPPIDVPIPELARDLPNCGIVAADQDGPSVRVQIECSGSDAASSRRVAVFRDGKNLAETALPKTASEEATKKAGETLSAAAGSALHFETSVAADGEGLSARLLPEDALVADDESPVRPAQKRVVVGVYSAPRDGAEKPIDPIERGAVALHASFAIAPLGALPERLEDLKDMGGLALDDPPGFTPEERALLVDYVKRGGLLFVGLGAHAVKPLIGSSFSPFLEDPLRLVPNPAKGIALVGATLPEAARSFASFPVPNVVHFGTDDLSALTPILSWDDQSPFLARRPFGKGEVWLLDLPFGVDASDVALRPGFLAMLDDWFERIRSRRDESSLEVGTAFSIDDVVTLESPNQATLHPQREGTRIEAERIGRITLRRKSGAVDVRLATAVRKEMSLAPRPLSPKAAAGVGGAGRRERDVAWIVALLLLGASLLELTLRLRRRKASESAKAEELPAVSTPAA